MAPYPSLSYMLSYVNAKVFKDGLVEKELAKFDRQRKADAELVDTFFMEEMENSTVYPAKKPILVKDKSEPQRKDGTKESGCAVYSYLLLMLSLDAQYHVDFYTKLLKTSSMRKLVSLLSSDEKNLLKTMLNENVITIDTHYDGYVSQDDDDDCETEDDDSSENSSDNEGFDEKSEED
ncbi:uncharacterized protein LOC130656828 [Hydractinia symbiolongicarpus]|uniref:uncharacterized protein LOC130656828 n=1 Tax=Hydractinia symbiolongicarpus TaxID=13093 RepID=UPI00254B96F0|nr:uncharacterized protein LOC130656828 [Hydractinia symbiolongicarpus]